MAIIQSGASADLLTVDATSKAIRVTEYDTSGNLLTPAPAGVYMLPINVRASAALTAAAQAFIWAMRINGSATKSAYIRRIHLRTGFDGTAAASSLDLRVIKFGTATPTAGTALTPIPLDPTFPATIVSDARVCSGAALLTVTSVVEDANGSIAGLQQPRQNASNGELELDWYAPLDPFGMLKLSANDGLALRIYTNTVIGDVVGGFIEWEER